MNKLFGLGMGIVFGLAVVATSTLAADLPASPAPAGSGSDWKLVWSDEFNQPDGSRPDTAKWGFETGGNGWGNNELEYYTDRTNNAVIADGKLVIQAQPENYGGQDHYLGPVADQEQRGMDLRPV